MNAWLKLKPDQALVEKILAALEVQKKSDQWTRDSGKYIPLPSTWLNGRRWEDEDTAIPRSWRDGLTPREILAKDKTAQGVHFQDHDDYLEFLRTGKKRKT